MHQLNDDFLDEVGLGALPEDQRLQFLEHVYESLEDKVGRILSDGLTDAQLAEFAGLVDRDGAKVEAWLAVNSADYSDDPTYQRIMQEIELPDRDPVLLAEYAATKWLEVNRPDYRDQVLRVMDQLKSEIKANRDQILGQG